MGNNRFVPSTTEGTRFSMLRQEHFEHAAELFGTDGFDRLFMVHAIDPEVVTGLPGRFGEERIYWRMIPTVVEDLMAWYRGFRRLASLRHSLIGDLIHLLAGYCSLTLPESSASQKAGRMS